MARSSALSNVRACNVKHGLEKPLLEVNFVLQALSLRQRANQESVPGCNEVLQHTSCVAQLRKIHRCRCLRCHNLHACEVLRGCRMRAARLVHLLLRHSLARRLCATRRTLFILFILVGIIAAVTRV